MSGSILPKAYLIVDNSVVSMLTKYFCQRNCKNVPKNKFIPALIKWLADQLDILRKFTPDNHIHCTDLVVDEYRPDPVLDILPWQVSYQNKSTVINSLRSTIRVSAINIDIITKLRTLPQANKRLVGPNGLSDNDFSLVVLALQFLGQGHPVYILSNDQDLLTFVSWMVTRPEARNQWQNLKDLVAKIGLAHLEAIHRSCVISTSYMTDLLNFAIMDHYQRQMTGTKKGKVSWKCC